MVVKQQISSFLATLFGIAVILVSLVGLAITQGWFTERLEQFPPNPMVYFIISIVIGLILIFVALKAKKYQY